MRILGIDPGIAIVGYSIIDVIGNTFKPVDYGYIATEAGENFPERLVNIYNSLDHIIKKYNPDEVAIEELFFNKNVKTAISVGHARGVEILCCALSGLNIYEYTPLQIKQAVTGYGRADKKQMQDMVKLLLNLNFVPKPDDVADAIAVAITHGSSLISKDQFRLR